MSTSMDDQMPKNAGRLCPWGILSALVAILMLIVPVSARAPDTLWTKTFGGGRTEWGYSVRQTTDGGFIVAGTTWSYGAGDCDIWLIKTDNQGNMLWNKTYGGPFLEMGHSVQQTFDGGYVIAGVTESFGSGDCDFYLVKTDSAGGMQWARTYGGTASDVAFSVCQTADNGYILTGYTDSYGAGREDIYLVKVDANGDTAWTKTYGYESFDNGNDVIQTSDGGYVITGVIDSSIQGADIPLIKTDATGQVIWARQYGGRYGDVAYAVKQTRDGGFIVAGWTDSYGAGKKDVFLIRTNSAGDTIFTRTFGFTGHDEAFDIQQTDDDGFIAVGRTSWNVMDVYVIKTSGSGDSIWTKRIGGPQRDDAFSVRQTTDGGYIITGLTESFGAGYYDVYLIRLAAESDIKEAANEAASRREFIEISPNPFRGRTDIRCTIHESRCVGQKASLKICDATGQVVRSFDPSASLGARRSLLFIWDGCDDRGNQLPVGVYFVRLKTGTQTYLKKVVKLR